MSKDLNDLHDKLKDHEKVEAAEKWWKSKSKMAQLVLAVIAVAAIYNIFFV